MNIGDRVKFLNEKLSGKIKSILLNNKFVIAADDGFDYEVDANEIIIISEDNEVSYEVNEKQFQDKIKVNNISTTTSSKGFLNKYLKGNKLCSEGVIEVDLHLEELVEFPQKLANWQKLHTQMEHVKKCLAAAFDSNVKKLVFIHGKGTGVLKTSLLNYLSNFDNIVVNEASYQTYGVGGATEVLIKN